MARERGRDEVAWKMRQWQNQLEDRKTPCCNHVILLRGFCLLTGARCLGGLQSTPPLMRKMAEPFHLTCLACLGSSSQSLSLSHLLILLALCVLLPHISENFLSLLLDSPLQNHTKEQGLPPWLLYNLTLWDPIMIHSQGRCGSNLF